jgi:hypothetical protein
MGEVVGREYQDTALALSYTTDLHYIFLKIKLIVA